MKFLTNAAKAAAKDFMLKYKPLYCGLLLTQQLPGKLTIKPVDGQHVTTCYKPTNEQWLECAFGGVQGHIRLLGYAINGNNEGVNVALKGYNFYAGARVPHVTLSCSAAGKAVDTAYLPFRPLEDGSKGWKQRLSNGDTVKWVYPANTAIPVEATAFYGNGKSLSIKAIQKECIEYIAAHCPEELQAAEAYKKLQAAKEAKFQAAEALRSATYQLDWEAKNFNQLLEELNKPALLREAEAALEKEYDTCECAPDDEFIVTSYTNTVVHFKWTNYNGTPYATGIYTHATGIVYDK